MTLFQFPAADAPRFARLRHANLLLLGLMPASLLLMRGGAEVIMAVIGLSFLWVTIAERQWHHLTERPVAVLLVTWLLLNLVVSPLALDPGQSYARSLLWLRFIMFFAGTATWLIQSRRDLKILAIMWSATLACAMLDGYVQYFTGASLTGNIAPDNRLTGPLERPNIGMFTARIGFPLLAAALTWLHGSRKSSRYAFVVAAFALITFTFIILSGERSAAVLTMLSVVVGAGIIVLLVRQLRLYGLLLGAAVPVVFLALYEWSEAVHSRVADFWSVVDNFGKSPYGEVFRVAFQIWQHYPIAGSGMKGYQQACELLSLARELDHCYPHAHNIYLEWLSESGLIGLICFVAFVALLVWQVLRLTWTRPDRRLVGAVLCGGLIVTLFPLAATQSFFSNWPAMVVWTALGVIAGVARLAQQEAPGKA